MMVLNSHSFKEKKNFEYVFYVKEMKITSLRVK